MNVMNRLFKLFLAAAFGSLFVGCYNDFDTPGPAKIYTRADFEAEGLTFWSPAEVKAKYKAANSSASEGAVASLTVTEDAFTGGKVISSDRAGNIYKALYIYDEASQSAIELRLNTGNYLFYPVGKMVFVKLKDLVVGNYRGMISIGAPSADPAYSNGNIVSKVLLDAHVFGGEQQSMTPADTLVVTKTNYATALTDAALGRLVRFEGVASKFGAAEWGYRNTYPNYFANSMSFDVNSPGWEDFFAAGPTWAAKRKVPIGTSFEETFYYGSAWFTYGGSTLPGNYVVRTSGYSQFRENKIPSDGTVVDITAIYTKFTGSAGQNPTYQLSLNSDRDVTVK